MELELFWNLVLCNESHVVRFGFKLRQIMGSSQGVRNDCWTIPLEDVPQFAIQTEQRLKEVRTKLQALQSGEYDVNLELEQTQLEEKHLLRVLKYCSCRLKEEQIKDMAKLMLARKLSPRDAEKVAMQMRVMRADELGKTATQYMRNLTDMSESEEEKEFQDRKRARPLMHRKRTRTLSDKSEVVKEEEI